MPGRLLLLGLVMLPLAGQWAFVVNGWAWLTGDPVIYALAPGTEEWSHRLTFLVLFVVVAAWLVRLDGWLAALVLLAGVQSFTLGPRVTSAYFLLGVGALVLARLAPPAFRAGALSLLGWSGMLQALVILAQWMKGLAPVGSFGVNGVAAGYVATMTLLLPGWCLPVAALAILATSSRAALIAFVLGVGVRYAPALPWSVMLLVLLVLAGLAINVSRAPTSANARVLMQRAMFTEWTPREWVLGAGLGAWRQRAPEVQMRTFGLALDARGTEPKVFLRAHNDLAQWVYETGAAGALLLAGCLARQRRALLRAPSRGALAALSVMALTWFPFYALATGLPAAYLVGLATAEGA